MLGSKLTIRNRLLSFRKSPKVRQIGMPHTAELEELWRARLNGAALRLRPARWRSAKPSLISWAAMAESQRC